MKQNSKKYKERTPKRRKASNIVYLTTLLLAFEAIGLSLIIFPRSTVSITEKRELKTFPEFSLESYFSGDFTKELSEWFSDTVPYRDELTGISAGIRELRGFRLDDTRYHDLKPVTPENSDTSSSSSTSSSESTTSSSSSTSTSSESSTSSQTESTTSSSETSKDNPEIQDHLNITNNGIAVVGDRALMMYGGSFSVGERYAKVMNKYKQAMPNVNVYSMIIPTACEFYSPASLAGYHASELDNINHVNSFLQGVTPVDAYSALAAHTSEDIYLRTDHHWAPLGAYYAAQQFAKTAGVPFKDISEYDRQVVHGYVGTMYGFTEDIVLKNNPEDFVYYVPKTVQYTTTYYEYELSGGRIVGARPEFNGNFFIHYGDGNGMAYCTFMGGDSQIVKVKTNAGTGRKLAILKDSYGNALPGYLMGSFDEIIVIDMRYFTHNVVDFLTENGTTDILFANNAFHAATASTVDYYESFLTQQDWGYWQTERPIVTENEDE
ncbi:MAG: DHHW family protein [Oscillospiraceae bacterium]|nr:DHHW family protein [Oscillospiraceae bacterium]